MSESDESLSAKLSSYSAPKALLAAIGRQEQPDVVSGQLWRARVDATTVLVLILETLARGSSEVAIATPGEIPPADSAVEHLDERTDVYRRLTVWPSVHGLLHQRVLDKLIEHSTTTTRLSASLRSQIARDTAHHDVHDDVHDPGAELLAELRDDLRTLQNAPGVPVRRDDQSKLADVLPGDPRTQMTTLMTQLAVPQQQAMQLLRGLRELTAEQARALEQELDLVAGSLPAGEGLAPDLALEVEHPRWREAARRRAQQRGLTEVEGRASLAAEAYALAARESTATPDWRQRLAIIVAGEA